MGCEIRSIKHDAPRFAVFDGKKTVVRIGQFYINLIIDNESFTEIFKQYYDSLWSHGKRI
jgi:hypothetical protein